MQPKPHASSRYFDSTQTHGLSSSLGKRKEQQDSADVWQALDNNDSLLLVVADGVGSTQGAATASRIAVESFISSFGRKETDRTIAQRLEQALNDANDAIKANIDTAPHNLGMSTTLVAAYICDARLWWISVGDSPLYLIGKKGVRRVNADHSLAASLEEMARQGLITQEQALNDPARNQLTSALSGQAIAQIDCPNVGRYMSKGQRVMAASDGIHTLSLNEITLASAAHGLSPQMATDRLVEEIEKVGHHGQDNVTIALSPTITRTRRFSWAYQAYGFSLASTHQSKRGLQG